MGAAGAAGAGLLRGSPAWAARAWLARSPFVPAHEELGPTEELGRACVKSEGVWLGAIFFFPFSLIVQTEKKNPFYRFSRGDVLHGPGLPHSPSFALSASRSLGRLLLSFLPFPALPHLQSSRASQRVSGVSAKRPGHLSWQLHGNPGASAVWSLCGFLWQITEIPLPAPTLPLLLLHSPNPAIAVDAGGVGNDD